MSMHAKEDLNGYIALPQRGMIHIEGADRYDFLNGLITQDALKLRKTPMLYSALLTPQGKFLHDFFMHQGDGFIMLDCEGGARTEDLYERLLRYRLRKDVQLSFEPSHPVYAVFGDKGHHALPDPRHKEMGWRTFEKPADSQELSFEDWDKRRIALGLPDGSRDLASEKTTVAESGLDQAGAIDWDKGCYMGQELTARMKHRNLGKKRLAALQFDHAPPAPFTPLTIEDKTVGDMRSSCGPIGLAVIRNEYDDLLQSQSSPVRFLGLR